MVSNSIEGLVRECSIQVVYTLVCDAEIWILWEALVWVMEKILEYRIVVERDAFGIYALHDS